MEKLPEDEFLFTSESVTPGHPDKLCDYISDSVLDACLAQDPQSMVACESACKNSLIIVFGEVSTNAKVVFEQVVREAIKEIGYDNIERGLDYKNATVMVALDKQSQEIADSVHVNKSDVEQGAGDQGFMIGYATDETKECMPYSHLMCIRLVKRLVECRVNKILPWVGPDAKVQVTVQYKFDSKNKGIITPLRAHTILISCQHLANTTHETIENDLRDQVIKQVFPANMIDDKTILHLNPSGKFVTGGPMGDAGLTGRKIIVDTYGGWGGHGGGAFSGKDSSKVDRSGAYAARWIAKSLVTNGFCKRCQVQVAYGIGIAHPISVFVQSYETVTKGYTDYDLAQIINRNFDLRPGIIQKELKLKRPIFKKTAMCGHFGNEDPEFLWEFPKDLKHEMKKE